MNHPFIIETPAIMERYNSYSEEKIRIKKHYAEKLEQAIAEFNDRLNELECQRNTMFDKIRSLLTNKRETMNQELRKAFEADDKAYKRMLLAKDTDRYDEEHLSSLQSRRRYKEVKDACDASVMKYWDEYNSDIKRNKALYDYLVNQAKLEHNRRVRIISDEREAAILELRKKLAADMRVLRLEEQKGGAEC